MGGTSIWGGGTGGVSRSRNLSMVVRLTTPRKLPSSSTTGSGKGTAATGPNRSATGVLLASGTALGMKACCSARMPGWPCSASRRDCEETTPR